MRNGPYELIIAPPDYSGKKYRDKFCYEHHLVWWQNTGKIPEPNELIHHKNKNKRDNAFSNLEKITKKEHDKYHAKQRHQEALIFPICSWCEKTFEAKSGS